ncbi:multiple sugar transport system substrate-binding protein [Agromyces terreus]|uniref:Multiple sugar transport system substrate-binding protein n=1 Tax=Agromyces terreus TaxID=424795 RepID=A0A9X2H2G8_9MICO|nr:ABC transporter substrate-binding protein [Agromyces terreus]MCP2369647.1 multiple sugar transport system substrate-binding protein [Agromyces terreus]
MTKRLAAAGLAVATALTLSACSTPAATSTDQESTHLTVWFPGNLASEIEWVNTTVVPEFEEANEGVTVDVEFVDWGDLSTRLSTAFAGGTAPDVFGHGNAAAAGFADAGRVLNLDDYVATLDPADVDDMVLLDHGKVDGSQYIVPLRGFGQLLAYRTDLLEEAGIDEAPTDWADLQAAADKLTVREGDQITRSGVIITADNPTSMSQAFGSALFQNDGDFLSEDGTEVTWDSPEAIEALDFLVGLYNGDDAVATGLNEPIAGSGAQHPLATGRAAMAFVDDATLKTIYEQAPEIAEKIAVAPPLEEEKQASFGGAGNGLFISADSKAPDAAWEFIEFLTSAEKAKEYVQVVGGIPARASLADDADLAAVPYIKPFADALPYFQGNPNVPAWTQLRDLLSVELEKALHGAVSPEEALTGSAKAGQELLSE